MPREALTTVPRPVPLPEGAEVPPRAGDLPGALDLDLPMAGEADALTRRMGHLIDLYDTRRAAAATAGVSTDQITRYAQGRSAPPFEVMARLAAGKGVSLDWLATGTSPMRRDGRMEVGTGLPVIGLTQRPDGWYLPRRLGVRLPAPADARGDAPLAILATDDSLLGEGVRPGHVCFAHPGMEALEGDLVYVVRVDGPVALRRFDGRSGSLLRLATDDGGSGSPGAEVLDGARIELLCPVVSIRRKW